MAWTFDSLLILIKKPIHQIYGLKGFFSQTIHFLSFDLFLRSFFLFVWFNLIYLFCFYGLSFYCKIQRIVCNADGLCPIFFPRSITVSGLCLNMVIQFQLTLNIRTQVHSYTCGNKVFSIPLTENSLSPKLTDWIYLDLFLSYLFCYTSFCVCFHISILLFWLLSACNIYLMWSLQPCLTFPE